MEFPIDSQNQELHHRALFSPLFLRVPRQHCSLNLTFQFPLAALPIETVSRQAHPFSVFEKEQKIIPFANRLSFARISLRITFHHCEIVYAIMSDRGHSGNNQAFFVPEEFVYNFLI